MNLPLLAARHEGKTNATHFLRLNSFVITDAFWYDERCLSSSSSSFLFLFFFFSFFLLFGGEEGGEAVETLHGNTVRTRAASLVLRWRCFCRFWYSIAFTQHTFPPCLLNHPVIPWIC